MPLRESKLLYEALFTQAADAIVLIDALTGEMVKFNQVAYGRLGYTADEFGDLDISQIDIMESEEDVKNHLAQIVKDGQACFPAKHQAKNGDVFDIQVRCRAIMIENQPYIQSVWHDVTAERRSREALQRERAEAMAVLQAASHDLRMPLRTISQNVGIFNGVPERTNEVIRNSLRHMTAMLDDLDEYARTGSNGELVPVDLWDAFTQALGAVSVDIKAIGGEVVMKNDLPIVYGNQSQLVRLYQNLLDNAIKYRSGKRLRVEVGSCGNRQGIHTLWVRDNGIGIPEKFHAEIFDPFRRLHTWYEIPGTGLGLSACKRIVEQHGGSICVESKGSEGAAFIFTLKGVPDGEIIG